MAKENQLKVQYRDGSNRLVQVDNLFFESVNLFDHKIGKMVKLTAREKSISLAESLGREPYSIQLIRDNKELFKRVTETNKPIRGRAFIGPKDKKATKKALRKKFKNTPFTGTWRSWEGMKSALIPQEKAA